MAPKAPKAVSNKGNTFFSETFLTKALGQKVKLKRSASRIHTDSRSLKKGDLFAAIPGDAFDGHDFIEAAAKAGAVGAIVSQAKFKNRDRLSANFSIIQVKDTTQALRKIALAYRKQLKIPIIAVAGSNGKTTTKEWIAFLLREVFGEKNIFKTQKSNNSILGIALSLLQIRKEKMAVIEIGIDEPGWMDQHLEVVQPTHGIITTIAEEHLNRLKNIETIAKEELKLLKYLCKTKGFFAANHDSDWIQKSKFPEKTLTYALDHHANIEGRFSAPQTLQAFGLEWTNPLPGKHNTQNLLAALTILRLIKSDLSLNELSKLSKSISKFEGEAHRSRLVTLKNNIRVFDDCYNANPDSVEKSLQAFHELSEGCIQKIVLGDMLDLGDSTEEAHRRILNKVLVMGFDKVYLFGDHFKKAFEQSKIPNGAKSFLKFEDLIADLKKELQPQDFVFLKGSRGMKLERVLEHL